MNSTRRFSRQAQNYRLFRPGYPAEAIDHIYYSCSLKSTDIIADVGSGTGIFSKYLLQKGNRVLAIEPNEEMRREAQSENHPALTHFSGTAEHTTLPDHSVDYVVCAQAFHWVDPEKAKTEFCRILKDHKTVVVIWNNRDTRLPFLKDFEEFLLRSANNYAEIQRLGNSTQNEIFDRFYQDHSIAYFPHAEELDFPTLKGRVLSYSYVPQKGEKNYSVFMEQLIAVYEKHQYHGTVPFHHMTQVIIGSI